MQKAEILVIALVSPILTGVYRDGLLAASFTDEGMTSDVLALRMKPLLQQYDVTALYYAKGPGSFMAIKLAYVFLKTLAITKGIPLYASDGFSFNGAAPIKATGKRYYVKEGQTIKTCLLSQPQTGKFALPPYLKPEGFTTDSEPLYIAPAV